MEKTLAELTYMLVMAHTSNKQHTAEDIHNATVMIHDTLRTLQQEEKGLAAAESNIPGAGDVLERYRHNPKLSIKRNTITCLICGEQFQLLTGKHLRLHDVTVREYKKRYRIGLTTALSSRLLTSRRKEIAKERGHGAGLARWKSDKK